MIHETLNEEGARLYGEIFDLLLDRTETFESNTVSTDRRSYEGELSIANDLSYLSLALVFHGASAFELTDRKASATLSFLREEHPEIYRKLVAGGYVKEAYETLCGGLEE